MDKSWVERWDKRYSNDEFAYGEEPNNYLKEQLEKLPPGAILFPAEGEVRNAVFAAKLGWIVSAFDISIEGKSKALQLATANNVTIDYEVGALETLNYCSIINLLLPVLALVYFFLPTNLITEPFPI